MFQKTTATNKISALRKRIRGVAGGTSASKTISILLWLIDRAMLPDKAEVISVVSESMPHLRRGAMRDFLDIMQTHGYFKDIFWDKTNSIYTFKKENGTQSIIEFFGTESWEKVKGARRDILFINEANHILFETFNQLEVRTKKIIWLDWNPENEFWFYTDILGQRDDVDFITLTYKDNEALEESIVHTIEARKGNANWWKVYGLGQLGDTENRIYTGWNIDSIDEIPHDARLERYGLDFGYSNDPTAIVAIYRYNNAYILDEICYLKGMSNKDIADLLINLDRRLVIADSAEPKSIDEIKGYGINITPAQKGSGSVLQGIQYVQDQQIFVTKRSTNLIKEYRNYLWLTDKEGKIINEPQEFMNHCMDAIRYGMDNFQPGHFKMNTAVGGVLPFLPGVG